MRDIFYTAVVFIMFWAILWMFCLQIDANHCRQYGMSHYKTTIGLDAYCQRSDGLIVPAWKVDR